MQRSFPPGSEWLYIKIYCGFGWIDKLLTNTLYPLVQQLKDSGVADRWFFIRYQDPDMHIRIRFHLTDPASQVGYVLQQVHSILQSYLDTGVVQRVQLDTYVRETERYDEQFMELSERFFWIDSEAVVSLLGIAGSKQTDRWLLALKGADSLLDAAGYTASERLALYQQLQQQFFDEHKGNDDLMLQLNRKFREHRQQVGLALGNGNGHTLMSVAAAILEHRTSALRQVFNGRIPEQLLPHYLHMFLNRMFTANARMQELVIYHYLMKHYTSVVARGNNPIM
jgi:thiopeptide-type bacteriocin biosynthesis protein